MLVHLGRNPVLLVSFARRPCHAPGRRHKVVFAGRSKGPFGKCNVCTTLSCSRNGA